MDLPISDRMTIIWTIGFSHRFSFTRNSVGILNLANRHYNAVVAADMSRDSIFGIFSTILDYFLQQGFEKSIMDLKDLFLPLFFFSAAQWLQLQFT